MPNVKYTDRVRLHPTLARLPPMPYRHRDSMSRKLRAMRDARERRRLEGVEPRYPRELPSLRRTARRISRAALWPGAPVTPPPGWAPEPNRYNPRTGER